MPFLVIILMRGEMRYAAFILEIVPLTLLLYENFLGVKK